jgi:hypothetical protein
MTQDPADGVDGPPDRAPAREPLRSGATPGSGEVQPEPTPLHPALVPRGESITWSATGSLLAGPIVWGAVGLGLDRIFGTGHVFLAIGAVVGSLAGFWIVYLRFGRGEADQGPPQRR